MLPGKDSSSWQRIEVHWKGCCSLIDERRVMKQFVLIACTVCLTCIALLGSAEQSRAQDAPTLLDALRSGSTNASFLLRGEGVETSALDKSAGALTLRTQLGYEMAPFRGWSGYVEFEAVSAVLGEKRHANAGFGDSNNGVANRPVIADPGGSEMNQGWVRFEKDAYRVTVGRQEIVLSDSRFVGNVGWRQNHQSFDAARVDVSPSDRISGTYAFVREAHRITRQEATMRSHLAEGRIQLGEVGTLSAFAFVLDYPHEAAMSRSTFGARFQGLRAVNDRLQGTFEVSYAMQRDAFDNPTSVQADYLAAGVGLTKGSSGIEIRFESLSGSTSDGSFVTPLATLHKFNGWADVFLATPTDGLTDFQVTLKHTLNKVSITVVAHDFSAQDGDRHHGREVDLSIGYPLRPGLPIGLKMAHYMADETAADLTKVWIWTRLTR